MTGCRGCPLVTLTELRTEVKEADMAVAARTRAVEQLAAAPERGQLAQMWLRFRRHKLGLAGLITLTLLTLSVIFVPMISPFQYDQIDPEALVPDAASP